MTYEQTLQPINPSEALELQKLETTNQGLMFTANDAIVKDGLPSRCGYIKRTLHDRCTYSAPKTKKGAGQNWPALDFVWQQLPATKMILIC